MRVYYGLFPSLPLVLEIFLSCITYFETRSVCRISAVARSAHVLLNADLDPGVGANVF